MKNCLNCNKELTAKAQKVYCSNICQRLKQKQEIDKRIEEGNTVGIGHRRIRAYLIDRHGAKCMDCKWDKINPHTGLCPIELEHLDGNSENNALDNLRLLCPSCHSLTATYKALNKGSGRHNRRQRYKEGKSF